MTEASTSGDSPEDPSAEVLPEISRYSTCVWNIVRATHCRTAYRNQYYNILQQYHLYTILYIYILYYIYYIYIIIYYIIHIYITNNTSQKLWDIWEQKTRDIPKITTASPGLGGCMASPRHPRWSTGRGVVGWLWRRGAPQSPRCFEWWTLLYIYIHTHTYNIYIYMYI